MRQIGRDGAWAMGQGVDGDPGLADPHKKLVCFRWLPSAKISLSVLQEMLVTLFQEELKEGHFK